MTFNAAMSACEKGGQWQHALALLVELQDQTWCLDWSWWMEMEMDGTDVVSMAFLREASGLKKAHLQKASGTKPGFSISAITASATFARYDDFWLVNPESFSWFQFVSGTSCWWTKPCACWDNSSNLRFRSSLMFLFSDSTGWLFLILSIKSRTNVRKGFLPKQIFSGLNHW